jgi:D-alanine-D-alanine ligase
MDSRNFQIAIVFNQDDEPARGAPQDLIAIQDTAQTTQYLYEALLTLGYQVIKVAVRESIDNLRKQLGAFEPHNTFVFFNCDGFCGETYGAVSLAQTIEDLGFKHTGSTAGAIALCTNKAHAKARLLEHGIPTPAYQVFEQPAGPIDLEFPLIVKPLTEDASLGIDLDSVVCSRADLFAKIKYILEHYTQPALVEAFIPGRELAVAMWGNEPVACLPIAEEDYSKINDPHKWLLTYEAKWLPESPYYHDIFVRCPAELTPKESQSVFDVAVRSFKAIGLRDFGRVDIRFHNQIPYVIDINDLPDLSPESGFPKTAMAAGYTYLEMVERILDIALRREAWR